MSLAPAKPGGSRALRLGAGIAVFQAAWFGCVLGAARGQALPGIAAVAAALALLLGWSTDRRADLGLIALALAVGLAWDSVLARSGIVAYASPGPLPGWAPAWILALWALLAPMLRESMGWLHGRPVLSAPIGGAGGVLSYAAAERLGACRFPDAALAQGTLAVGWALITPLLLAAARRLARRGAERPGASPRREARA